MDQGDPFWFCCCGTCGELEGQKGQLGSCGHILCSRCLTSGGTKNGATICSKCNNSANFLPVTDPKVSRFFRNVCESLDEWSALERYQREVDTHYREVQGEKLKDVQENIESKSLELETIMNTFNNIMATMTIRTLRRPIIHRRAFSMPATPRPERLTEVKNSSSSHTGQKTPLYEGHRNDPSVTCESLHSLTPSRLAASSSSPNPAKRRRVHYDIQPNEESASERTPKKCPDTPVRACIQDKHLPPTSHCNEQIQSGRDMSQAEADISKGNGHTGTACERSEKRKYPVTPQQSLSKLRDDSSCVFTPSSQAERSLPRRDDTDRKGDSARGFDCRKEEPNRSDKLSEIGSDGRHSRAANRSSEFGHGQPLIPTPTSRTINHRPRQDDIGLSTDVDQGMQHGSKNTFDPLRNKQVIGISSTQIQDDLESQSSYRKNQCQTYANIPDPSRLLKSAGSATNFVLQAGRSPQFSQTIRPRVHTPASAGYTQYRAMTGQKMSATESDRHRVKRAASEILLRKDDQMFPKPPATPARTDIVTYKRQETKISWIQPSTPKPYNIPRLSVAGTPQELLRVHKDTPRPTSQYVAGHSGHKSPNENKMGSHSFKLTQANTPKAATISEMRRCSAPSSASYEARQPAVAQVNRRFPDFGRSCESAKATLISDRKRSYVDENQLDHHKSTPRPTNVQRPDCQTIKKSPSNLFVRKSPYPQVYTPATSPHRLPSEFRTDGGSFLSSIRSFGQIRRTRSVASMNSPAFRSSSDARGYRVSSSENRHIETTRLSSDSRQEDHFAAIRRSKYFSSS